MFLRFSPTFIETNLSSDLEKNIKMWNIYNRHNITNGKNNGIVSECTILLIKLKSSLRKFYVRHHDFVNRYEISVSQMTTDMFRLS
jgi:hypothetical protein